MLHYVHAALFIIARSWKEPRCPSTEEWIQNMWYIYTMEYYSAIKNNALTDKWILAQKLRIPTKNRNNLSTNNVFNTLGWVERWLIK